jgi:hypothetical protein
MKICINLRCCVRAPVVKSFLVRRKLLAASCMLDDLIAASRGAIASKASRLVSGSWF